MLISNYKVKGKENAKKFKASIIANRLRLSSSTTAMKRNGPIILKDMISLFASV